jgi:hypothetical protein
MAASDPMLQGHVDVRQQADPGDDDVGEHDRRDRRVAAGKELAVERRPGRHHLRAEPQGIRHHPGHTPDPGDGHRSSARFRSAP